MLQPYGGTAMPGSMAAANQEFAMDLETAMEKGYKFIKLIYESYGGVPVRISGPECVKVRRYQNELTKAIEAHCEVTSEVDLMFVPNPNTGQRIAYMLDTEGNRKILATHLSENRWTIADTAIREEIEKIAKTIPVERVPVKGQGGGQIVVPPEDELKTLTDEELQKEIEKQEMNLKKMRQMRQKKADNDDKVPPHIVKQATDNVHKSFATLIEKMKATYGAKKFMKSEEYLTKIKPSVDHAVKEMLAKGG